MLVGFFCLFFLWCCNAAKTDCSVTASDGTKYDLSGLSGVLLECTDSKKEYLYKIDPCAPTISCHDEDCVYCQEGITWNNFYCIATGVQLTGKDGGAGVTIEAVGGEGGRAGKIDITCDSTAGQIGSPTCISPSSDLTGYRFSFSSSYACPGGGGGGLSGGSILLIILLVLSIVYFGGGSAYNKFVKQESGVEVVPNIDFWREFPGLVQEGVLFCIRKVKGSG